MNPVDAHVGQNVAILRKREGVSSADFALALSISVAQLELSEKGEERFGANQLFIISRILKAPLSAILDSSALPSSLQPEG